MGKQYEGVRYSHVCFRFRLGTNIVQVFVTRDTCARKTRTLRRWRESARASLHVVTVTHYRIIDVVRSRTWTLESRGGF